MPRPEPLPWPFEAVVDSRQRRSGWVTLHSHVRSPDRMELFARLRRSGTRFLGMTSDGTFPAAPEPGSWEPLDYGAICEAWAHCFRDPGLLPGVPRDLLCRSDFTDAGLVGDTSLTGS